MSGSSDGRIHHAFTVTELVAVLAVIAVVLAIAFPAARRVTSAARTAACLTNHRQLAASLAAYATANAGRLPCPRTDGSEGDGSIRARVEGQDVRPSDLGWSHWWVRAYSADGHAGLVAVDGRPSETIAAITSSVLFPYVGDAKAYVSPDEPARAPARVRSYSINSLLGTTRPNENINYDRTFSAALEDGLRDIGQYNTTSLSMIRDPAKMLCTIVEDDPTNYNTHGWVIQADRPVWTDCPAPWRPDAITMSFADGGTGTYALARPGLASAWAERGHNYEQGIDLSAGHAIDWKFFRERLNPGILPPVTASPPESTTPPASPSR